MLEPEIDEKRIKRLESTVDALTYHLKRTNELLLLLAADKAKAEGISANNDSATKDILSNLHAIQTLKPCRKHHDY